MKFLSKSKDGGAESTVTAYWLIELKWLFSIALLRFDHGTRDAYHSHAFNSISFLLNGRLREELIDGQIIYHQSGLRPILTRRTTTHKVFGLTPRSWVLTFRGPWVSRWYEVLPQGPITLTHGRKPVAE